MDISFVRTTERRQCGKNLQRCHLIHADDSNPSFIHDAKDRYNVLPLRLGNEFSNDSDITKSALSVCNTHDSVEKVDFPILAGVVKTWAAC